MVQEENRISWGAVGVLHDRTDSIVTPGMSSSLRAARHVCIVVLVVASIDYGRGAILGFAIVVVAGKTMHIIVGAGSHVDGKVGKLLVDRSAMCE